MKWSVKFLTVLVFLFTLVSVNAHAAEADDILNDFKNIIPEGVEVDTDELTSSLGVEAILAEISLALSDRVGKTLAFFLLLLGFAVVISISTHASLGTDTALDTSVQTAVSAIAAASIFAALYDVCSELKEGLSSVVDFLSSAIPIFTLISTSSGAFATASAQAFNMNLTLALVEKFCTGALLPTSFAVFSLGFFASVTDSGAAGVARGVKAVFMWGVGIVGSILAATVAMQSVVASAADNAALRAARYAASGMIPIVGSTVASALSTLGGGMAYLKSTVGMGSVAVILLVAIAPLVSLLLYRLAISCCLIYLEFSGSSGGVRCYSAFRAALDTLIAVYSVSVLVCIIELVVFVKGGAHTV
jgi:stage III sporulation protein AE